MSYSKAINLLAVAQDDQMRWSYPSLLELNGQEALDSIEVEDGKSFNFTWSDVEAKKAEIDAEEQAKIDLKDSAKAKLIAGEALTQEEADTIVL
tara:strand:+ start:377 stop:658 length:282 start_codon:yes stop_codon:yes gene_type:complete